MATRMPAVFIGHGNPMNAIQENEYTAAWARLGASIPKPKAVLAISAHWYGPSTSVTAMKQPRTIHDFGGFPLGSGNLVHNLHAYAWGRHPVEPFDWAVRFEDSARQLMMAGEHGPLVNYESLGRDALLSIPTPDHYLPLLYVLGAQSGEDRVTFPVEGVDGGSISMLALQIS